MLNMDPLAYLPASVHILTGDKLSIKIGNTTHHYDATTSDAGETTLSISSVTFESEFTLVPAVTEPSSYVDGHLVITDLKRVLPGLKTKVACPHRGVGCTRACGDGIKMKIVDLIPHLNDICDWSRERIADWLETLDVDLNFYEPDETVGTKSSFIQHLDLQALQEELSELHTEDDDE